MTTNDTIRSGDAESRIPTWASRSSAVIGAIVLAVAFLATTPAARVAIAAVDEPAPSRETIDGRTFRITEPASADIDLQPRESVREPAAVTGVRWPGVVRMGRPDATGSSPEFSVRFDRPPAVDRAERRNGRTLASRVFVGLYRHLESGLRHLTAPAFGSTAP